MFRNLSLFKESNSFKQESLNIFGNNAYLRSKIRRNNKHTVNLIHTNFYMKFGFSRRINIHVKVEINSQKI
jgi:hypothetical protein